MHPRDVSRRFFEELWNGRDLDAAERLISPDCVTHQLKSAPGPMPAAPRGPEAVKEHVRAWLAAFPDLRWEIEHAVADGERVVTWAVARGTHRGAWQGVAPTGREVVLRCVVLHRVEGGRIAEDWVMTESLGLYQQLELVASTPALLRQAAAEGPTEGNRRRHAARRSG